jgi:hypothetical protein
VIANRHDDDDCDHRGDRGPHHLPGCIRLPTRQPGCEVEAVNHRDAETVEQRDDRKNERVCVARNKPLGDVNRKHDRTKAERQPDDGWVEFARRAEVNERECG